MEIVRSKKKQLPGNLPYYVVHEVLHAFYNF